MNSPAGGLASFRSGEVDLQPEFLRHPVGGAEDLFRFRGRVAMFWPPRGPVPHTSRRTSSGPGA